MPLSLKKFGIKLSNDHLRRERALVGNKGIISGELGDELDKLDDSLLALFIGISRRVFQDGKAEAKFNWARIRNRVINIELMTPYHQFRNRISKVSVRSQRVAFREFTKEHKELFMSLYPVEIKTISKKAFRADLDQLEFMDNELELKFLNTGREVSESVYFEEMMRIRDKLLVTSIEDINNDWDEFEEKLNAEISKDLANAYTELTEAKHLLKLNIGTGKISDDFKMFLERQLAVGLNPADLITTVTTRQIAEIQRILLNTINEGLDIGIARKRLVEKLAGDFKDAASAKAFESNVMRIMRTAHQRSAASAVSLWGLRNRDIVTELERVADGRPCIACFTSEHNINIPNGNKKIREIQVGDIIFDGYSNEVEVEHIHRNWYEGDLIYIEFEDGNFLECTPDHRIFVLRDGEIIKVPANELTSVDILVSDKERNEFKNIVK